MRFYDLLVFGEARNYVEELGFRKFDRVSVLDPGELDKTYDRGALVFIKASNSIQKNKKLVKLPIDGILDPVFPRMNALDYNSFTVLRDNDTPIVFSLSRFMKARGIERARLIERARMMVKMAVRKHVRVVITSGAVHPFDLRTPIQLVSFGEMLGLNHAQSERAISSSPEYLIRRKFNGSVNTEE